MTISDLKETMETHVTTILVLYYYRRRLGNCLKIWFLFCKKTLFLYCEPFASHILIMLCWRRSVFKVC